MSTWPASRRRRPRATMLAVVVIGLLGVLLTPGAAAAHSSDGPRATDYRSRLVSVQPRVDGLRVDVVANGTRLEVDNRTGADVVVLGYAGEPYRRLGPDGAYVNVNSPSYAVDEGQAPSPVAGASVGPDAVPRWQKVSDQPLARWHDHRVHWTGSVPPPGVAADPGRAARVRDWQVDLDRGGARVAARGTLDYLPPPESGVWWAGVLAVAAALALVGVHRLGVPLLAGALAVAAVAEIADAVGRSADRTAGGAAVLGELLLGQTYGVLTAVGALGAVAAAVLRRPAAVFALGLAGACLAVVGGVVDAAVFSHGQVPVPWDPGWARLGTAATVALSAGVAVGAVLRIRAGRTSGSPVDEQSRAAPVGAAAASPPPDS